MLQQSYRDIVEDSASLTRERESDVFRRVILAMQAADREPGDIVKRTEAIQQVNRLWCTLLEDVARKDNALPDELRADIISIGIFVLKRIQHMRQDPSLTFETVTEISERFVEGLG